MEKIYKTYTIFLKTNKQTQTFISAYLQSYFKVFFIGEEENLSFRGILDFYCFDVYLII